jgi:hypothetical protein
LNKLLHDLVQNLNTPQKNLPTSQYELGIKCPHAEGLKGCSLHVSTSWTSLQQVI